MSGTCASSRNTLAGSDFSSGFDRRSFACMRLQSGYVHLPPRDLVLQFLPAKARVSWYEQLSASINTASSQMAGRSRSLTLPLQVRMVIDPPRRADIERLGRWKLHIRPSCILGPRRKASRTYYRTSYAMHFHANAVVCPRDHKAVSPSY
jgi:hypothetical protein